MQQAIETLVELSRDALDVIAWALTGVLDKLSKEVRLAFGLVDFRCS